MLLCVCVCVGGGGGGECVHVRVGASVCVFSNSLCFFSLFFHFFSLVWLYFQQIAPPLILSSKCNQILEILLLTTLTKTGTELLREARKSHFITHGYLEELVEA